MTIKSESKSEPEPEQELSSDHQHNTFNELPKDILMKIFSGQSFGTVFKLCIAYNKNNEFRHTYFRPRPLESSDHIFNFVANPTAIILAFDCHVNRNNLLIEYHLDNNTIAVTSFDPEFVKDIETGMGLFDILSSYHGWLLIRVTPDYFIRNRPFRGTFLRLMNPMTGECLNLPKPSPRPRGSILLRDQDYEKYLMGCSPTTGQYKVVRILLGNCGEVKGSAEILTSGSRSWRRIYFDDDVRDTLNRAKCCSTTGDQVELNGALHWLILGKTNKNRILRFNIDREDFDVLHCPSSRLSKNTRINSLSLLRGLLCLFTTTDTDQSEIWVMNRYGCNESWFKTNESRDLPGKVVQFIGDDEKLIVFENGLVYVYDRESEKVLTKVGLPIKGKYSDMTLVPFSPSFLPLTHG